MDDITYGFLKYFSDGRPLSVHDLSVLLDVKPEFLIPPIKDLIENNYVQEVNSGILGDPLNFTQKPFVITYAGNAAMILYRHEKRHFRFSEFRAWCTLAIALLALILSLINMLTS